MDLVKTLLVPAHRAGLVVVGGRSRCLRRRATRRRSPPTSRAPSRSTRAATSGCSASPSARSTRVEPTGTDVRVTMTLRRRRQGAGRRQGRDHRAVGGRRPLRPADPGLHRRGDGPRRRRRARRRPDRRRRSSSTRSTTASTASTSPSARTAPTRPARSSDLLSVTADNFGGQGTTVPPDDQGLLPAQRHPRRQQGGAVRVGHGARGLHQTLADNDQTVRAVQPVAGRRLHDARGRARGAVRRAQQPRRGADRGQGFVRGEPGRR